MTAKRRGILREIVVILSLICVFNSCTYDYFEDENNFRLYVPQIQDGSIQNFYVAFHDMNGRHVLTRQLQAPFDKDDLLKQGILRFKLYPGKYAISCFADYTPGSITEGADFDSSSKGKDAIDLSNNIYASRTSNPRSYLTNAMAVPIGHPDAKVPVNINIDEKQCFKGKLTFAISGIPDIIKRIDLYYSGLATKYYFNGLFGSYSPNDRIKVSINAADYKVGNSLVFTDIINPTVGTSFGIMPDISPAQTDFNTLTPLEFEMMFYDDTDNLVGTLLFNPETLKELPDDKKPKDVNGNPIQELILMPQAAINFQIAGFLVISIELVGWGDTDQGEITPL